MRFILIAMLLSGCVAHRPQPRVEEPRYADPHALSRYLQRKEAESDFTRFYWSHPEIYKNKYPYNIRNTR